ETPIPLWRGCSESGGGKSEQSSNPRQSAIQTVFRITDSKDYTDDTDTYPPLEGVLRELGRKNQRNPVIRDNPRFRQYSE
ncbi:MAG TPA: hypothetical protein P5235_06490, partial [Saprospiraceae bacterium]|nr:hypothetical protein [Saprospiraceae bacterium]